MNSQQENLTSKEKGLIKHLSTRNYQLDSSDLLNKQLMEKSSKTIMKYGGVDAIKEFRIDYGKSEKGWCPTTIRDYTNKKGFKSLAHFNGNKYIGSVKANGKTPIAVTKWEVPTKDKWKITDNKFFRLRQDIRAFFPPSKNL